MKKKSIKANEFDEKFDQGGDIVEYLDLKRSQRPGLQLKRVSVDFPVWMINALDREAIRMGVPRQSVIKYWISEMLKSIAG